MYVYTELQLESYRYTFATNFPLRRFARNAVALQNPPLPIANIRTTIPDGQSAPTSLFGNFSLSIHFPLPLEF